MQLKLLKVPTSSKCLCLANMYILILDTNATYQSLILLAIRASLQWGLITFGLCFFRFHLWDGVKHKTEVLQSFAENDKELFSYASSSTVYPCESLGGSQLRTSVALRLASWFQIILVLSVSMTLRCANVYPHVHLTSSRLGKQKCVYNSCVLAPGSSVGVVHVTSWADIYVNICDAKQLPVSMISQISKKKK